MWRLVYYETLNGRRPVQEYLDSLDDKEAAKILYDLDLLEDFGIGLGAPHVRSIRGKLWELRTTGRTQHRILYFAITSRRLVLLHAFTKKAQTTPQNEIDAAMRRMADYLERTEK